MAGSSTAPVLLLMLAVLVVSSTSGVTGASLIDNVAVQWNHLFNLIQCRTTGMRIEPNIILAQLHLSQWHALLALKHTTGSCTTEDIVVAFASHTVLSNYFPYEQVTTIDPLLDTQLNTIRATDSQVTLGKRLGEAVALGLIDKRRPGREFALRAFKTALNTEASDPAPGVFRYLNNTPAGREAATFVFYNIPINRPYLLPDPLYFIKTYLSDLKPPVVPSPEWDKEYNMVKDAGRADWEGRTSEMNSTAAIFGCPKVNTVACFPETVWGAIARAALPKGTSLYDTVTTFAKLSVAMHDGLIILTTLQYGFWFWRPEMAMKAGDADHPPIPNWTPFWRNPVHAEYPSGTVTTYSTGATVMEKFFGKKTVSFTVSAGGEYAPTCPISGPIPDLHYNSFAEVVRHAQLGRIYVGAHFNKSVIDAVKVGESVANYVEEHWGETTPSGVLPDPSYLNVFAELPKEQGEWSPIRLTY